MRVDDSPFPTRIPDPTLELFRRITPHAPWALKPVLANAAKMRAVVARALQAAGPETNAMTRTTAVTTTLRGAPAHNVIPTSASPGVMIGHAAAASLARGETISLSFDPASAHVFC